jgi:hypothetical protein
VISAVEKTVDGVTEGEIRSETRQKGLFCQHDDVFASFRSPGTLGAHLFGVGGATSQSPKGARKLQMARPPHNSGLHERESRATADLAARRLPGTNFRHICVGKES